MSKELQMVFQVDKVTRSKLRRPIEEMKHILATDVGSTTTKARFFQRKEEGWRYIVSSEAPTTVEAPYEDVTMGVKNAVREAEELTGHQILSPDGSGVILDGRGRPLRLLDGKEEKRGKLIEWFTSLDMYPEKYLGERG